MTQANLFHLGPSNTFICNANKGGLKASAETRVDPPVLPPKAGNGIITLQALHLLIRCSAFTDQDLIMIFHPHFEGVTMHQLEVVHITDTGEPIVTGYRKQIGNKFWQVPIKPPQDRMLKKLALVDQLLLSKLPPVLREQVSEAKKIVHTVYEIPSLNKGMRWIHAVCGYPAKPTWIKTICAGTFAG